MNVTTRIDGVVAVIRRVAIAIDTHVVIYRFLVLLKSTGVIRLTSTVATDWTAIVTVAVARIIRSVPLGTTTIQVVHGFVVVAIELVLAIGKGPKGLSGLSQRLWLTGRDHRHHQQDY